MKVITFSRFFPKGHPKAGQETFFREKIWAGLADKQKGFKIPDAITDWDWYEYYNATPKFHTIRAGNRWKVGDEYSPRVWSGKPYASKQIEFALPIRIEKIWKIVIEIEPSGAIIPTINDDEKNAAILGKLALNDGLDLIDFANWFNIHPKNKIQTFTGQILCHNPEISY
jgi:hypothetical protein